MHAGLWFICWQIQKRLIIAVKSRILQGIIQLGFWKHSDLRRDQPLFPNLSHHHAKGFRFVG